MEQDNTGADLCLVSAAQMELNGSTTFGHTTLAQQQRVGRN